MQVLYLFKTNDLLTLINSVAWKGQKEKHVNQLNQ